MFDRYFLLIKYIVFMSVFLFFVWTLIISKGHSIIFCWIIFLNSEPIYIPDEAAMVYLAYQCVNDDKYYTQANAALDYILFREDDNGAFGNEYSTALAVQVRIVYFLVKYFGSTSISLQSLHNLVKPQS